MAEPIPPNTQLVRRERPWIPHDPPHPQGRPFPGPHRARPFRDRPWPRPHRFWLIELGNILVGVLTIALIALLGGVIAWSLTRVFTSLVRSDYLTRAAISHAPERLAERVPVQARPPAWIRANTTECLLVRPTLVKILREQRLFISRTEDVFFDCVFADEPWTPRLQRQYATDEPILHRGLAECYATGATRNLRSVVSILQKFSLTETITDFAARSLSPEFAAFDNRPLDQEYTYLVLDLWSGHNMRPPLDTSSRTWYAFAYSGGAVELIARQSMPQNADEWRTALLKIRERGVKRVSVVASDSHPGLGPIIESVFPGARWIPCCREFVAVPAQFMPIGADFACIIEYCDITANGDSQRDPDRVAEWRKKWRPKYFRLCGWLVARKGNG